MFLSPIGLLALAAVPAILAIHFFRRRFEPRTVSAVFLWRVRDRTPAAGRKLERLRTSASLWLELAAALLLTLALAGFRPFGAGGAAHLVVVLDGSFAMGTRLDGETLRDRAVREVRARIDAMSSGASVTLVQSGPVPAVLAGPRAFPREALEKLLTYEPFAPNHDVTAALALAQQLGGAGAVLLVARDFQPEGIPANVEIVSVGGAADNVAVTHASRTKDKIFVNIEAFTRGPVKVRFVLSALGSVVASRDLDLAAGGSKTLTIAVPPGAPALTGALEADRAADALEADSRITLAPPPPRRVKLTSSLPDEAAKSLALWSGKGSVKLDRLLELVSDAETAESAASAHLELCESAPASPRAWSVSFEAKGKERAEWIGPYLKDKRHPLMEGITLDGVIWSADPKHALSGVPIVSCGDQVLVSETRDGDKRLLRVKLDGGRSNLPRSPDWPIFLSNLVEARRAALPGPARTNLAAGEPFVFQAAGDAVYTVALDDRTSEVRARGALVYEDAARPGLYKVSRKSGDGAAEPVAEFAVNLFDASLSDARGLEPGARPAEAGPADSRARYSWVEAALVVAAMACVALDWFVLASGRRR